MEYRDTGQTFSIISLVPAPEFVDRLAANFDAELAVNALLNESGAIEIGLPNPGGDQFKPLSTAAKLSASVKVRGGVKIALSLKIMTPLISTMGVGSRQYMFEL